MLGLTLLVVKVDPDIVNPRTLDVRHG